MADTQCPKCFREGATWAHVEDCDGSVTKPMLSPVVCASCGVGGHKADECPLYVEDELKAELAALRAIAARLEDMEGRLCRAREALQKTSHDEYEDDAWDRMHDALSSSSPCSHEKEAKRLREAVRRIYTTQVYEHKKRIFGISVELVSSILDAATLAGCRIYNTSPMSDAAKSAIEHGEGSDGT